MRTTWRRTTTPSDLTFLQSICNGKLQARRREVSFFLPFHPSEEDEKDECALPQLDDEVYIDSSGPTMSSETLKSQLRLKVWPVHLDKVQSESFSVGLKIP